MPTPAVDVFTGMHYGEAQWPQHWMSIWGASPTSVWFAGSSTGYRTALHDVWYWDGTSFSLYSDSQSFPSEGNLVWGTSTTSVLVLGAAITRWDGSAWARWEPADSVEHQWVGAVSGSSMSDVWLLKWDQLLHWNGAEWHAFEFSGAKDVWARSADDTWVVGVEGWIRHWDGSSWSESQVNGIDLAAVWADAPGDVWAVGQAIAHYVGPERGWITMHDDGRPYVDGAHPLLSDVWGIAQDDVWAVGDHGSVLHWDGRSWTHVAGFADASLQVVWGNESDVWIGGDQVLYRMRR